MSLHQQKYFTNMCINGIYKNFFSYRDACEDRGSSSRVSECSIHSCFMSPRWEEFQRTHAMYRCILAGPTRVPTTRCVSYYNPRLWDKRNTLEMRKRVKRDSNSVKALSIDVGESACAIVSIRIEKRQKREDFTKCWLWREAPPSLEGERREEIKMHLFLVGASSLDGA